jgi:hypothetical protein
MHDRCSGESRGGYENPLTERSCRFESGSGHHLSSAHRVSARIMRAAAQVLELVDKQDLGSCAARRVGSSPTLGTISNLCELT